jgi:hypothetical protein
MVRYPVVSARSDRVLECGRGDLEAEESGNVTEPRYESPQVWDVGEVRDLVKGSSTSGNADANTQYYW